MKCIVTHEFQTIPHQGMKRPYLPWEFKFPEMLQGVIVETRVKNSVTGKFDDVLRTGRIVARTKEQIDVPEQYRV